MTTTFRFTDQADPIQSIFILIKSTMRKHINKKCLFTNDYQANTDVEIRGKHGQNKVQQHSGFQTKFSQSFSLISPLNSDMYNDINEKHLFTNDNKPDAYVEIKRKEKNELNNYYLLFPQPNHRHSFSRQLASSVSELFQVNTHASKHNREYENKI